MDANNLLLTVSEAVAAPKVHESEKPGQKI